MGRDDPRAVIDGAAAGEPPLGEPAVDPELVASGDGERSVS